MMWQLSDSERQALEALCRSRLRLEADRARAILLSAEGWSSAAIAEVVSARADTVRHWRMRYRHDGARGLRLKSSPGRPGHRGERALCELEQILEAPRLASEPPWTLPRLQREVERRCGVRICQSWISCLLRKKGGSAVGARAIRSRAGKTPKPSPPPART
jgi:transposase